MRRQFLRSGALLSSNPLLLLLLSLLLSETYFSSTGATLLRAGRGASRFNLRQSFDERFYRLITFLIGRFFIFGCRTTL